MRKNYLILVIALTLIIFYACQDSAKQNISISKIIQKDTLSDIYIRLYPSFINFSTIRIDRIENLVTFTVDSVSSADSFPKPKVVPFTTGLDEYEALTNIKSFYDTAFTNSIKHDPNDPGIFDGISITTFLVTSDKIDTIQSGNVFPKSLSDNLIKQISFISDSTSDKVLKEYLKNLKSYFD